MTVFNSAEALRAAPRATPYRRAQIVSALTQAALQLPFGDREKALARIPEYRSRGKGRGAPERVYGNKPGKYTPHQGERECARRRLQTWGA